MQINGCADTASSSIVGSQQPATLFGKRFFTAGVFIAPRQKLDVVPNKVSAIYPQMTTWFL
jgi:hypothetical protein